MLEVAANELERLFSTQICFYSTTLLNNSNHFDMKIILPDWHILDIPYNCEMEGLTQYSQCSFVIIVCFSLWAMTSLSRCSKLQLFLKKYVCFSKG